MEANDFVRVIQLMQPRKQTYFECAYCFAHIPTYNDSECVAEPTKYDFWPGQQNGKPWRYFCDAYCQDMVHGTFDNKKIYSYAMCINKSS